jgi:hypothetical protein
MIGWRAMIRWRPMENLIRHLRWPYAELRGRDRLECADSTLLLALEG